MRQRVKIVEKTNGSITSTKNLIWVGSEICEGGNTNNSITKRYYGQGMKVGNTIYYYTRDHLGSIRELTNSSGAVQTRYDYDPYGRRTKLTGSLDADFGFTGHYYHQPSALNLALYRAYDADLGRWISRDPIAEAGGINLYGYVGNDPVNMLDPLGLLSSGAQQYFDNARKLGNNNLYDTWIILNRQRDENQLDPCPRDAEHYAFAAFLTNYFGPFGLVMDIEGIPAYSLLKVTAYKVHALPHNTSKPSLSEFKAGFEGMVFGMFYDEEDAP